MYRRTFVVCTNPDRPVINAIIKKTNYQNDWNVSVWSVSERTVIFNNYKYIIRHTGNNTNPTGRTVVRFYICEQYQVDL